MIEFLCTTCFAVLPSSQDNIMLDATAFQTDITIPFAPDTYKKGPKNSKNSKNQKSPHSMHKKGMFGRITYEYTSLGFLYTVRNTRNFNSKVIAGPVDFDLASGEERISSTGLKFDTTDVWNTAPLDGFKINYGRVMKKRYLSKVGVSLITSDLSLQSTGGNDLIEPITMDSPFLFQLDYTLGGAFKVLGAMAYAGVNVSGASYTVDIHGWHRPEDYEAPESIQGVTRKLNRYVSTPLLRTRQLGIGVDAGAMLVSYKYSPNKWLGVEWNGTAGVFLKDVYVTNSINLVFENR
jgi:hypothetical protein